MQVNKAVSFTGKVQAQAISKAAETCGGIAKRYATQESLGKEMMTYMPAPIKFLSKIKSFTGEVPNIIINALGTGLIAPIFIRYNCFAKTDEDTRSYSALRQPLSAVLAVITQAGLVIPFDKIISRMSNEGSFKNSNLNKTGLQDVDYIAKQLKKEFPNMSAKDLKELAKKGQLAQLESLTRQLENKGTIEVISNGKKVILHHDEIKGLVKKTTDSMLEQLKENLIRYDGEKAQKQIQRGEFLRTNGQKVKEVLKEIESLKTQEEFKTWSKAKIKALKADKTKRELIDIISEIGQRPNIEGIKDKAAKTLSRCEIFAKCKTSEAVRKLVHAKINKDIKALEAEKKLIQELQTELKKCNNAKGIKALLKKAKGLKNTIFGYEVIQKHLSDISSNIKGLRQVVGLGVSLAILPATCCILNYVYPRFVEAFFPHLAKKPAKQGDLQKIEIDLNKQMQEVSK